MCVILLASETTQEESNRIFLYVTTIIKINNKSERNKNFVTKTPKQ